MDKEQIARLVIWAAIGGTAGYFTANFIYNQLYEEVFEDDILFGGLDEEDLEETQVDNKDDGVIFGPPKKVKKGEKVVANYAEMYKQGRLDLVDEPLFEPEEDATDDESAPDQVVTLDFYELNPEDYGHVTFTYYEGDDVVVDETDKVVVNPEELIGEDTVLRFGELSEDPDVVYVRNDKLGLLYEVIRLHDSYDEVVLGNKPEKPKKAKKMTKAQMEQIEAEKKRLADETDADDNE